MHTVMTTVVMLEQCSAKALAYSSCPRLMLFDGTERAQANFVSSSFATFEAWKPGSTALLKNCSLTFKVDAGSDITYGSAGAPPTVQLSPKNRKTAEIMSQSIQAAFRDSACVTVQAAVDENSLSAGFRPPIHQQSSAQGSYCAAAATVQ